MHTTCTFLLAAAICFVSVSCYKEELMATMKNCKNGAEVTKEEVEEFVKPLIPKTRDEKCLMACVMKTYNIISDGMYDPKIALAVTKDLLKDDPEKMKKIQDIMNHCKDDMPGKMDDDCELAGQVMQCVVKYEKDMGLA